jgi:hopanoid biosynthesis associated protein HpnK
MARRVIFSADDFGLSVEVNEAVEAAHRDGLLGAASLMVAGPAAADAVERARRLPALRVGLHLVVIEGPAVLPPARIPDLAGADGQFPSRQVAQGFSYFFRPRVRRQLAAEIEAQFAAFAATGLPLDHANAHKHMHLHPTIGALLIRIGRKFGLGAVRVPFEPPVIGTRGFGTGGFGTGGSGTAGFGAAALRRWCGVLRGQARRAGMLTNDAVFGLGWTGHMTAGRLLSLAPRLPEGLSEIYFHPATAQNALLRRLMPDYEPAAELAALTDPAVAEAFRAAGAELTTYSAQRTGM